LLSAGLDVFSRFVVVKPSPRTRPVLHPSSRHPIRVTNKNSALSKTKGIQKEEGMMN